MNCRNDERRSGTREMVRLWLQLIGCALTTKNRGVSYLAESRSGSERKINVSEREGEEIDNIRRWVLVDYKLRN